MLINELPKRFYYEDLPETAVIGKVNMVRPYKSIIVTYRASYDGGATYWQLSQSEEKTTGAAVISLKSRYADVAKEHEQFIVSIMYWYAGEGGIYDMIGAPYEVSGIKVTSTKRYHGESIASISGTYLSSDIPNIIIPLVDHGARVQIVIGTITVYDEVLYATDGNITIFDVGQICEPWLQSGSRTVRFRYALLDKNGTEGAIMDGGSITVWLSRRHVAMPGSDFISSRILSLAPLSMETARGRKEYIHLAQSAAVSMTVRALYPDLSTRDFHLTTQTQGSFQVLDVSPARFSVDGEYPVEYTVVKSSDSNQSFKRTYVLNHGDNGEWEPILMFRNSFGVRELLYCTGTCKHTSEYERMVAVIGNRKRNYRTDETQLMECLSGIIPSGEEELWRDMLRSDEVTVCHIEDGEIIVDDEVHVREADASYTNDWDNMSEFSFTLEVSDRRGLVQHLNNQGIFDYTYDESYI